MRKAIFHLKRDHYRNNRTLGIMYSPNGEKYCYVLEDTVRGYGIKDKGNTAIPATEGDKTYFLRVRQSPKYGKVVVVFTEQCDDLYTLRGGGIEFNQILCHGGNDEHDTMGCLLVNKNRSIRDMSAWKSMKAEMVVFVETLLEDDYDVRLKITNLPQNE